MVGVYLLNRVRTYSGYSTVYLDNILNIEISKAFAKDHLWKNSDEGCVFKESSCCKIQEVGFENSNICIQKYTKQKLVYFCILMVDFWCPLCIGKNGLNIFFILSHTASCILVALFPCYFLEFLE